jgi:natural product precursor
MKKESYSKKLSLNKATISNLDQSGMNQIKGGVDTVLSACITNYPPRCDSIENPCISHSACTSTIVILC